MCDQQAHALVPLYRARNLADKSVARLKFIGNERRVYITDHGVNWLLQLEGGEVGLQPVLGGFHQRTMEGCTYGQQFSPLGAALVGEFGGPLHGAGVA